MRGTGALAIFVVGLIAGAALSSRCERTRQPEGMASAPPAPAPTPPPPPYVPSKRLETGKIFNGMQYRVSLETEHGTTAAKDRREPENYAAEVTIKVKVPKPHLDLAQLTELNPGLSQLFPALNQLLARGRISPFYETLYRLKCAQLQGNLNRLDALLTRHNFYDTETIIELEHPETKRRALFLQADMDVDADGSDPDRVPEVDSSSLTFQPFTSYRWAKKSERPNPFLTGRQTRLTKAEQELNTAGLPAARARELKGTIEQLKAEIYSLTKFSFLVGPVDPFIVLPGAIMGKGSSFSPGTGDYCVVVFDQTLYPAIVGDAGPSYKTGEASLRICRQINARADSNNRPVSDLKVTYLVFPGTAEKPFGAPDLEKWRTRCAKLLEEFGGHSGELFTWEDLTKPKVVPPEEPKDPLVEAPEPEAKPTPPK